MKHLLSVTLLMLVIPSCTWKTIKPRKEVHDLKEQVKESLGTDLYWHKEQDLYAQQTINDILAHGVSRTEAIEWGLQHHPLLQSYFEKIGAGKAAVAQAGVYHNPAVYMDFQVPTKDRRTQVAQLDGIIMWNFLDLFFMPYRRKLVEDDLDVIMHETTQSILDTYAAIQKAYNTCLLNNALVQLLQPDKQQQKQEHHTSESIEQIQLQANKDTAYITLRGLLGINPTAEPIVLSESLNAITVPTIESLSALEAYALAHHPQILIAKTKIEKAVDSIEWEKGLFSTMNLGFAYTRNTDHSLYIGPALSCDIPLFDTNQGNIARAHYQLDQAHQEFKATKNTILSNIRKAYVAWDATHKIAALYKNADSHNSELYKKKITLSYEALNALVDLEIAVGKRLM